MTHRIGHFEDSLFAEQRLNLVAYDDVALFERLDGKVLACRHQKIEKRMERSARPASDGQSLIRTPARLTGLFVLRQDDLAEMATAQHAEQSKRIDREAGLHGQRRALHQPFVVLVLEISGHRSLLLASAL